jgi:hypothetical protein
MQQLFSTSIQNAPVLIGTIAKAKGVDPSHPKLLEAKSSLDNRLIRTPASSAVRSIASAATT